MITGLNHLNLSVSNIEKSFSFYTQKLNCKPLAKWKRGAYLLAGDLWLCLSLKSNTDSQISSDYTHYAFTVTPEKLKWYRQNIEQLNLNLWQENTSEGDSLYILDPDHHKLELHIGNWQTRLAATKQNPYEDMIFFD
ncbi:Glutathione transferase FosA [Hyella patelloides LEGE 07179]|uniref:Glutathione transferase FosA n=1 Tax=Hyella patelloides LEGE 07179 TaxID=945734 RepID=A0A563W537_9CYAN|nr:VOC family protein [Hyella patelloides]VEP18811.1 Glutathione transferase FosA [Hyella patelloides LEGE 07179]